MTSRVFTQRFSSTPLGARLARHLVVHQLHTWGIPHGTEASDTAALLVAELGANAVTHGRVPGRDFEVRVTLTAQPGAVRAECGGTLTVEVSDTRGECRPRDPAVIAAPAPLGDDGRGLFLVAACASRWSVRDRSPGPGKTVVAELDLKG